jgi:hypothetical protein
MNPRKVKIVGDQAGCRVAHLPYTSKMPLRFSQLAQYVSVDGRIILKWIFKK